MSVTMQEHTLVTRDGYCWMYEGKGIMMPVAEVRFWLE